MTRVAWIADSDGIAHAQVGRSRVVRAACGVRAVDERHAWPEQRRCEDCAAVVEKEEAKSHR